MSERPHDSQKTLSAEAKPFVPGGGSASASTNVKAAPFHPAAQQQPNPASMPAVGNNNVPVAYRGPQGYTPPPHGVMGPQHTNPHPGPTAMHHQHHHQPHRGYPPTPGIGGAFNSHAQSYGPPLMQRPQTIPAPFPQGPNAHMTPHIHQPALAPQAPYIVLVLGVPFSGKTSLAESIAKLADFNLIKNDDPETYSGFRKLDQELKTRQQRKGFVLDDFILSYREDAYYLDDLLKRHGLKLDQVVYLDMQINDAVVRMKSQDMDDKKMAQHAAHYDVGRQHYFELTIRPADILTRTPEAIAQECIDCFKRAPPQKAVPATFKPLDWVVEGNSRGPAAPATMVAKFITDYSKFLEIKTEVKRALGDNWSNILTIPGAVLNYSAFVRRCHSLRQYYVTPNINGQRVIVFKRGTDMFLIPEKQFGAFRVEASLVPTAFQVQDDFILDGVLTHLLHEKSPTLMLTDVLHTRKIPATATRDERLAALAEMVKDTSESKFVFHLPPVPIWETGRSLGKEWKFSGRGLLFLPPGKYVGGVNSKLFSFDFSDAPQIFRVWDAKEGIMDPVQLPMKAPRTSSWNFCALVRYGEEEGLLADPDKEEEGAAVTVQVSMTIADEQNINDGNLLEFIRVTVDKPKPAKFWRFVRRVDDRVDKPSTCASVDGLVSQDWTKDALSMACAALEPSRDQEVK